MLQKDVKSVKSAFYTHVNGDIVSYTSKTAKIIKGDITQQHIHITVDIMICCECAAEILLLPVSEDKSRPYWNSTSGFDFDYLSSAIYHFSSAYQIKFHPNRTTHCGVVTPCRCFMLDLCGVY